MNSHRLIDSNTYKIISTRSPFSSFEFVESNFDSSPAVHRCFSLARSFKFGTLIVEDISETGAVKDENEDISNYVPDYHFGGLKRLSFWGPNFQKRTALKSKIDHDFIGYAILKKDIAPSRGIAQWHIFEAVFNKYPHKHNCVPGTTTYKVKVIDQTFHISGVLYCQQNSLNKACAQVALRSIISGKLSEKDILYSKINQLAALATPEPYDPANGLNPQQMRYILENLNIPFRDVYYSEMEKKDSEARQNLPYQKYLYAGVESGAGALLGFKLSGPKATDDYHIIPFYGHTFNKDTWAPDAERSYFDVGGGVGYIPSESWTSSFIGHDDNFGPNFCVPRLYVKPEQAEYVVELLHNNFKFGGLEAEAFTLPFLYSLPPHLALHLTNSWIKRLVDMIAPNRQQVVLRAVASSTKQYLTHLASITDWEGNKENPKIPKALKPLLPDWLWIVEVSIPQLFPANERKLGEVVLNPYESPSSSWPNNFELFLFARIPGIYFIVNDVISRKPDFLEVPSNIKSHTELLKL